MWKVPCGAHGLLSEAFVLKKTCAGRLTRLASSTGHRPQARAHLAGEDTAGTNTFSQVIVKKKKNKDGQSWECLALPLKDPLRYQTDPVKKQDVSRLLMTAFQTGGIPASFAENYHFKLAMKTLQELLVGETPWKPPGRKELAVMRPLEAAAAVKQTKIWMASDRHVTLAVEGRKMAEGRWKESMLNTAAWASVFSGTLGPTTVECCRGFKSSTAALALFACL